MIATDSQLRKLLEQIEPADRIAIDTEADSLHSYREKLCLLQLSVASKVTRRDSSTSLGMTANSARDFIVDPLAAVDLEPLRTALGQKEIVLHGADYDLRMLRRGLQLVAQRVFDTVIAARLLGIREFSLAALLKRYFEVELPKGSQKANWGRRPLPARMAEYAINDVHYLLPLAEKLESDLDRHGRADWFRQSCERAVELAAVDRVRDEDEIWRIPGAGGLRGREAAILRALWQWRETEAEAVDRPAFHILQNKELLRAAEKFATGSTADFRHFSDRRRRAFRQAAEGALQMPEQQWPVLRKRLRARPNPIAVRRASELRERRDRAARESDLEPAFIAPRATLEAIAVEPARAEELLVPWQRQSLAV